MTRTTQPYLRYTKLSNRVGRVLKTIGIFYILLNGSSYCILFGTHLLIQWLYEKLDGFWAGITTGSVAIVLTFFFVFLFRRMRLSWKQMNLFQNMLTTLGVIGGIVVVLLIVERLFNDGFTTDTWLTLFQWLWQIPLGIFIGRGLGWAVVDRTSAGVIVTDERNVEGIEHHHDPVTHQ